MCQELPLLHNEEMFFGVNDELNSLRLPWEELFQDRPGQRATQVVRAGQVRYSKGHEESPFDIPMMDGLFLSMSDAKLLFHLFKRY